MTVQTLYGFDENNRLNRYGPQDVRSALYPNGVPAAVPARVVTLAAAGSSVSADCDVRDGTRLGGGTPTNNATAINNLIASAGPTNHLRILVNGGFAHNGITPPDAGCVTIEGQGSGTGGSAGTGAGFYTLSGANRAGFANAAARASPTNTWNGTATNPTPGGTLTFRNLFLNFNRGTFDGVHGVATPGGGANSIRGVDGAYWYSGVELLGYGEVRFEGCTLYDAPAYLVNLFACQKIRFIGCNFIAPSLATNTDAIHANGGTFDLYSEGNYFSVGDDAHACNFEEGNRADGGRVVVANCTFANCSTMGRVYGNTVANTRFISFDNCVGTVSTCGLILGLDAGGAKTADLNHDVSLSNVKLKTTNTNALDSALVWAVSSAGSLSLRGCEILETPAGQSPALVQTSLGGSSVGLSSVCVQNCKTYQSSAGTGGAIWVNHQEGRIENLTLTGNASKCQPGVGLTTPGALVRAPGGTFGKITISGNDWDNRAVPLVGMGGSVDTVVQSTFDTIDGPDVLRSGLLLPDAKAGFNCLYRGSDHGNAVCVKDPAGLVSVFTAASTAQATGSGAAALSYLLNQYFTLADNARVRITGSWERDGFVTLTSTPYALQPLFGKYGSTASEWLVWWGNATGQVSGLVVTTAGPEAVTFPTPLAVGVTYYVRFTLDRATGANGTISLDVNNSGTPVTLALVGTPVAATAQEFRLGSSSTDATWHLDGSLDKVSGTPRARTALERAWVYNGGHGRTVAEFGTGNGAALTYDYWYDFESAALTADSSGNALTLTAVGAPVRSQGVS